MIYRLYTLSSLWDILGSLLYSLLHKRLSRRGRTIFFLLKLGNNVRIYAVGKAREAVELAVYGAEDRAETLLMEADHADKIKATSVAQKKYKAILDMMPPAHEPATVAAER